MTGLPDPDPSDRGPTATPMSRRGLLKVGGLTVSLGPLVAACGSDEEEGAPGRVGYAPVPTDLPTVTVDDAVFLRTITSLEYSILDVYAMIQSYGVLDERADAMIDRFVEDHTRQAGGMAELTTSVGGEPYECANSWYAERIIPPLFERIDGNEAEEIPPSDDPARDLLQIAYAFESMLGATYQQFVERLTTPELRQEVVTYGAEEVRHAAAIAILRDGAPEAYISPVVFGEEIDSPDGVMPLYGVTGHFGSVGPIEMTLGPPNDAGTRFNTALQTPADNSYVYEGETCEA